ncbi:MAG: DUF4174 domain-containing protein [Gemmobacter sp.]
MKYAYIIVLWLFLPFAVFAQEGRGEGGVLDAPGVTLAEFQWIKRPVLIFADSPNDPSFRRQIELIEADRGELAEYDVVVIADANPAARSLLRQRFRPRGFGLVILDKDGEVKIRKPLPWDVREITHAIAKFPLTRQEMLERYPSGR